MPGQGGGFAARWQDCSAQGGPFSGRSLGWKLFAAISSKSLEGDWQEDRVGHAGGSQPFPTPGIVKPLLDLVGRSWRKRHGGMLNVCSNWEDLEAAGLVGDFPGRSGSHSALWQIYCCRWLVAGWGFAAEAERRVSGCFCCCQWWGCPDQLSCKEKQKGIWGTLPGGKVEERVRVHVPGLPRASGHPSPA